MTSPAFLDQPFFPPGMSEADPHDPISSGFFQAAAEGRLAVQTCSDCGVRQYPPELNCHACYGYDLEWRPCAGLGTVWSWVQAVHPVHPALREFGPYFVALVQLDDCPEIKFMAAVADAASVAVGDRMRIVFERTADDLATPRWAPL